MPQDQTPAPPGRPQNTWMPILLAFAVLVFSTVVVVAASLYFRDNPPPGATRGTGASAGPSASPSR